MDQVSLGAVTGLKNLSLSDSDQTLVSAAIAQGATQGMGDAGLDSAAIDARKAELNNEIALTRLGRHLVPTAYLPQSKVHFLDDGVYHTDNGEIHCGTNAVREWDLDIRL